MGIERRKKINNKSRGLMEPVSEDKSVYEDEVIVMNGDIVKSDFTDGESIEVEAVAESVSYTVSVLEYAIINAFFYDTYIKKNVDTVRVEKYGQISNDIYTYNKAFHVQKDHVFLLYSKGVEGEIMAHLRSFKDEFGRMCYRVVLSYEKGISYDSSEALYNFFKKTAFNLSRYKGKCLKISIIEENFRGIEILETKDFKKNLILNKTQTRHLEHFANRLNKGKTARYLFNGPPGCGKAQPLTAKILTPTGWTTMGDIKVGDEVLTPEGKVTKVSGVYPQGVKKINEITFKDGKKTKACDEHLWEVYGLTYKGGNRSWSTLDTDTIRYKIENTKCKPKIKLVNKNINTNIDKEYVIDPYLMGILLGDGSFQKDSIKLSTSDSQIVDEVKMLLPEKHYLMYSTKYDYLIVREEGKGYKRGDFNNKLVEEIRILKLSDKKSHTKFIPEIYKKGSLNQKISLIQGLMDSDGTVGKGSSLSFTSTSLQLVKDVQELIWSIGGVCKLTEKQTYYTYKGEKKKGKLSYKLGIRYKEPKELFRLQRKLDKVTDNYQYRDTLKNEIINIEYYGEEEAQCIMVEDDKHLYITDDYIVTHNTESIRNLIYELVPNVTFIMPDFRYIDDLNIILEACEIFDDNVIVMDDIDLFLGSRDNRSQTNILGQFLSFFDGVKKRKISILASTNDKSLVDKAAERPGRFNMILDYGYLDNEQIVAVCKVHLPKEYHITEIYDIMTSNIDGNKPKLTGAFIANFADNLIDMADDGDKWSIEDTKTLFEESYKGFYASQVVEKTKLGFH